MKHSYILAAITAAILCGAGLFILLNNKGEEEPQVFKAKTIEKIDSLHFSYSTGTMINAQVSYDIECNEKCVATIKPNGVSGEDVKKVELDDAKLIEIIKLLNDNNVTKWDGFNKSDQNVLDGNSFGFSLYANNKTIDVHAHGYMKWPDNYREVRDGLDNLFDGYFTEKELKELRGY